MKKRKIGIGTTSLVLFIIGSLFAFTFNKVCIGDNILNYIGLKSWSNGNQGTHYTLLFYIPSLIIGYKFNDNFGSKVGNILSTIMVTIIIVTSLLFTAII